jgi:hypothetical protein
VTARLLLLLLTLPAPWLPHGAAQALILDLDGLILDTESLCLDVGRQLLAKHGKVARATAAPPPHRLRLGPRACGWPRSAGGCG